MLYCCSPALLSVLNAKGFLPTMCSQVQHICSKCSGAILSEMF